MKIPGLGHRSPQGEPQGQPKKEPFVPTELELGLLERFGGVNKVPFQEFRREIVEAGVPDERIALVSTAIVESRRQADARGGPERR